MTYELAKELKDAGFLQPNLPNPKWQGYYDITQFAYYPTLSELIAACGDYFGELKRTDEGTWQTARASEGLYFMDFSTYLTPEEAVARLWLALNKK